MKFKRMLYVLLLEKMDLSLSILIKRLEVLPRKILTIQIA